MTSSAEVYKFWDPHTGEFEPGSPSMDERIARALLAIRHHDGSDVMVFEVCHDHPTERADICLRCAGERYLNGEQA